MGLFPEKALSVLRTVSLRMESWCRENKQHASDRLPELSPALDDRISENICNSASQMGMQSHGFVFEDNRDFMNLLEDAFVS